MFSRNELVRAVRRALASSSSAVELNAQSHPRQSRNRLAGAIATTLIAASPGAFAQSNIDGYVYGTAPAGAGSTIVLENVDTGARREITPDAAGRFRFSAVQAGRYKVTLSKAGATEEKNIAVTLGNGTGVTFGGEQLIGTVEVVATGIAPVDIQKTETSFAISEETLDAIPVARNLTAVSLLAPGAVSGDEGFGNLPSFGGSTVAENQYYLNGFNISDLRTRLGPSTVPFEFFQEFEVKSGGYSAEFGRATGGVVNAISKRGTNEFKFGTSAFYEPDWGPTSKTYRNPETGEVAYYYGDDSLETFNFNAYAGGPIIEDKLFFFVLGQFRMDDRSEVVQSRDHALDYVKGPTYRDVEIEAPFGAVKIDWQIADGHLLELTGFNDSRTDERVNFLYDSASASIIAPTGPSEVERGGETYIARYTGQLTDSLTFSALYGHGESELNGIPSNQDCQLVNDNRVGISQVGCYVGNPTFDSDERNAYRVDFTFAPDFDLLGRHVFRFGADLEKNESTSETNLSGGARYRLETFAAGARLPNGVSAPTAGDYVRVQHFTSAGTIEEELSAFYIEDTWSINDQWTAYIGLRSETFEYITASNDQTFVEFDGEIAPRLGLSWDFLGTGKSKIYANYGRYYLPLATQAAVRNQLGELYDTQVFRWDGTFSADRYSLPGLGVAVGPTVVTSDGEIKDPLTLVDQGLKPSYQDEYILGFETELPELFGKNSVGGIRFIYRDLARTVEDAALDRALNAALNSNPNAALQDCDDDPSTPDEFACGFDYYFITNPGQDATIYVDVDGDGTIEPVSVSAAASGLDEVERKYYAVELTYERQFDRSWYLQGSYTWSQSYGNYEGIVNSAIEQDDIAITQDFDQPGFMDGARGYTAADRRHKFKLYGAYAPIDPVLIGANLGVTSGRPVNAFAAHPTDEFAAVYGEFSFYECADQDGDGDCADLSERVLTPRGSYDRTPWTWSLDLSMRYTPIENLALNVDVFNVFNSRKATELNERSEDGGSPNSLFLAPVEVQTPRYYRFSVNYEF